MDIKFLELHLKQLKESIQHQGLTWVGSAPVGWATYVASKLDLGQCDLTKFSAKPIDRSALYEICSSIHYSDLEVAMHIMAWGGMRRDHGVMVLATFETWSPIVAQLRSGALNRSDAYQLFMIIRAQGLLKGMGPAFFTKIIFFSSPDHSGYIMDQWTGRSINLLLGRELVDLNKTVTGQSVSDKNSNETYDRFCKSIEALTDQVDGVEDPKIMEEFIFSSGGRKKGLWRAYTIDNS
jgi:hypothetical protein